MKEQDAAHSFPNTPKFPEKNWIEDYQHENGIYQNRCIECKELFFGHKRRRVCKECFNKPIDWEKMALKQPPEEIKNNAWPGCWADGEMTGFARCMVKKVKPLEAELTRLTSELQQKDEIIEVLKRGMQKGSEIYAHLRFDDEPFTPYQLALQEIEKLKSELQRERELRNELLTPKKQS